MCKNGLTWGIKVPHVYFRQVQVLLEINSLQGLDRPFPKGGTMSRLHSTGIAALAFAALTASAQAQAPAQPPFATTKVEGTENVYIFRYGGHQSMFVVTPAGVIATDPIGLRRPAAKAYIEEIQKVTKAPIKYVIYSHSHFDHIAGGKPFKDVGARFVAHQ